MHRKSWIVVALALLLFVSGAAVVSAQLKPSVFLPIVRQPEANQVQSSAKPDTVGKPADMADLPTPEPSADEPDPDRERVVEEVANDADVIVAGEHLAGSVIRAGGQEITLPDNMYISGWLLDGHIKVRIVDTPKEESGTLFVHADGDSHLLVPGGPDIPQQALEQMFQPALDRIPDHVEFRGLPELPEEAQR